MTEVECNYYSNCIGYETIFKPRQGSPSGPRGLGGGVAILIKKEIEFIQDLSFDYLNLESLSIIVNLKKKQI